MSCKSFFLVLAVLIAGSLSAQAPYQDAVGLRLGFPVSVSYKKFLNEKAAVEGYVGLRSYGFGRWFNISGAYQVHQPISEIEGLQCYYGGGASIFLELRRCFFGRRFFFDLLWHSRLFGTGLYLLGSPH